MTGGDAPSRRAQPGGAIGTGVTIQIAEPRTDIQFHWHGDPVYTQSLRHGTDALDELASREARRTHGIALGELELFRARAEVLSGAADRLALAGRDLRTGHPRTITLDGTTLRSLRARWLEPIREAMLLARERAAPVFPSNLASVACVVTCETALAPDVKAAFTAALELSLSFTTGRDIA